MKYIKTIFSAIALSVLTPVGAQTIPADSGLAADTAYIALLEQEKILNRAADSIGTIIDEWRGKLSENPDKRDEYSIEILRMEGELFDIRNQIGIITTRTNLLEQEYLLKNMSDDNASINNESLKSEDFFASNLTQAELDALRDGKKADSIVTALGKRLDAAVSLQRDIFNSYREASDKEAADSLAVSFEKVTAEITSLNDSLRSFWEPVYSNQTYAFERLLDKINTPASLMESLNEQSRNLRSREAEAVNKYSAPAFAMYDPQRRMLLRLGRLLADRLQMPYKADSCANELAKKESEKYRYAILRLPELTFVNFAPLKIGGTGVVSETNPPKELVVPSRGPLYKIELLTSDEELTNYTRLRKVNPVEYREIAGDKFVYYAGSYRTRAQAKSDYDRVRRLGISAKIAAWNNGVPVDENGVEIEEIPVGDIYRVEVYSMDDTTRDIIKEIAPDKDLMSLEIDGETVISVGPFEEYEKAKFLAKSLPKAKVTGIKLQ